jgi:hypothetical protein
MTRLERWRDSALALVGDDVMGRAIIIAISVADVLDVRAMADDLGVPLPDLAMKFEGLQVAGVLRYCVIMREFKPFPCGVPLLVSPAVRPHGTLH